MMQVMRLKYHIPDSELQNFSLQTLDMLQGNASLDAHALVFNICLFRVNLKLHAMTLDP